MTLLNKAFNGRGAVTENGKRTGEQNHQLHALFASCLSIVSAGRRRPPFNYLHVVAGLPAIGEPHVTKTMEDEKSSESQALKRLKELAAQRLSGLKYETLTETAFLADRGKAILTVAREIKPDLIVMPTHGRSGLARLVMGSVTESSRTRSALPCSDDKNVSRLDRAPRIDVRFASSET